MSTDKWVSFLAGTLFWGGLVLLGFKAGIWAALGVAAMFFGWEIYRGLAR